MIELKLLEESALDVEFFYDGCNLLHSRDARWDKRKTKFILNQSHSIEHCLDSCRISINEEEFEEFGKLMVNGKRIAVITIKCETNHTAEFLRKRIANNRDDTYSSQSDEREGDAIIT